MLACSIRRISGIYINKEVFIRDPLFLKRGMGGVMFEEIKEGLKKAGVRFDELRSFL